MSALCVYHTVCHDVWDKCQIIFSFCCVATWNSHQFLTLSCCRSFVTFPSTAVADSIEETFDFHQIRDLLILRVTHSHVTNELTVWPRRYGGPVLGAFDSDGWPNPVPTGHWWNDCLPARGSIFFAPLFSFFTTFSVLLSLPSILPYSSVAGWQSGRRLAAPPLGGCKPVEPCPYRFRWHKRWDFSLFIYFYDLKFLWNIAKCTIKFYVICSIYRGRILWYGLDGWDDGPEWFWSGLFHHLLWPWRLPQLPRGACQHPGLPRIPPRSCHRCCHSTYPPPSFLDRKSVV